MSNLVRNSDLIEDFLGYFPTFHDAKILSVVLDHDIPNITMDISISCWTGNVDSQGYYTADKSGIVKIVFSKIEHMELHDFLTVIPFPK